MNTLKNLTKYVFLFAIVGILSFAVGCSNDTTLPINVTGITITGAADAITVSNGETLQMSAAVLPLDATDASVTWSVASGSGTATISTTGLLTATAVGTVSVKATANDDSAYEGILTITVTAPNVAINIAAITGVTAPVRSVTPDLTVAETDQYTATITWAPSDSPYAGSTVYTATITLAPKAGYTTTGIAANSFNVSGATATNPANSGVVTAVFTATEAAPPTVVTTTTIVGVTVPATGATPDLAVTAIDQYTGSIAWSPDVSPYAALTPYTAIITLTAETGYTFAGVAANSFIVPDATTTNLANSGIVTAVFPATGAAPDSAVSIAAIPGVTAPVRNVTPVSAITDTAQYTGVVTWSPDNSPFAGSQVYTATITLTAKTGFTLNGVAANSFTVAGAEATHLADSGVITAVFPATAAAPDVAISILAIPGVTAPVRNVTPDLAITETDQYTGTVAWLPADSPYAAATVYTATITLTAKSGYTLTGVAANSFTVEGATITNAVNSGVVTAVFPVTKAVIVSILAIPGVTVPMRAGVPDLLVTETDQYTGSVAWAPSNNPYAASTVYTATITLLAKSGYTFTGVAADAFTVSGADTATNLVNSGVVTAVFPATSAAPLARVELGTAADYVILAETLISTTGVTHVTGDLGISPYATTFITGFALVDATGYATSSLVTGRVYAADMADPTPANLTTAVANMITAYNDAAARPTPDELNLGTGAIGGLILAPGLYKWDGTVGIGADLTLNGDANDIWIFQISGDLNMASDFEVLLTGGAKPENIFWQVAGIATLGTGAHMEGIILSMTQIILETGSSINGRLLAQTQVTLDAATVLEPTIL